MGHYADGSTLIRVPTSSSASKSAKKRARKTAEDSRVEKEWLAERGLILKSMRKGPSNGRRAK